METIPDGIDWACKALRISVRDSNNTTHLTYLDAGNPSHNSREDSRDSHGQPVSSPQQTTQAPPRATPAGETSAAGNSRVAQGIARHMANQN